MKIVTKLAAGLIVAAGLLASVPAVANAAPLSDNSSCRALANQIIKDYVDAPPGQVLNYLADQLGVSKGELNRMLAQCKISDLP